MRTFSGTLAQTYTISRLTSLTQTCTFRCASLKNKHVTCKRTMIVCYVCLVENVVMQTLLSNTRTLSARFLVINFLIFKTSVLCQQVDPVQRHHLRSSHHYFHDKTAKGVKNNRFETDEEEEVPGKDEAVEMRDIDDNSNAREGV